MITASLTVEDYIAAHRLFYRRVRTQFYRASALTLFIGLLFALKESGNWPQIVIWAGVGGLIGNWWEDRFGLPQKVEKLYGQFKGISEPLTFSWDSEHIEGQSTEGHGKRKWTDYVRFREDETVFLLYITDHLWHVYPKRWFGNPSQLEEFRKYAMKAGTN